MKNIFIHGLVTTTLIGMLFTSLQDSTDDGMFKLWIIIVFISCSLPNTVFLLLLSINKKNQPLIHNHIFLVMEVIMVFIIFFTVDYIVDSLPDSVRLYSDTHSSGIRTIFGDGFKLIYSFVILYLLFVIVKSIFYRFGKKQENTSAIRIPREFAIKTYEYS